eukprot:363526-Chlamydomonas_euryale.AAC.4
MRCLVHSAPSPSSRGRGARCESGVARKPGPPWRHALASEDRRRCVVWRRRVEREDEACHMSCRAQRGSGGVVRGAARNLADLPAATGEPSVGRPAGGLRVARLRGGEGEGSSQAGKRAGGGEVRGALARGAYLCKCPWSPPRPRAWIWGMDKRKLADPQVACPPTRGVRQRHRTGLKNGSSVALRTFNRSNTDPEYS